MAEQWSPKPKAASSILASPANVFIQKGNSNMENIQFTLTYEQAMDICEHFGEDINTLEDWEICELLDRLIDETLFI